MPRRTTDAPALREGVGAYRQADLEAMDAGQLRRVRDWAADQWADHEGGHPERDTFAHPCRQCTYYELLVGAAEDLLARRSRSEDL